MPVPEIPPMFSRHCHCCGSPVIFSQTHEPKLGLENRAHVTCPNCGDEGEITWNSAPLRIIPSQGGDAAEKEARRFNVQGAVSISVGASRQKEQRGWTVLRRTRTRHESEEGLNFRRMSARTERLRMENERPLSEKFGRADFQAYIFADIEPRLVPTSCSFQLPSFRSPKSPSATANLAIKRIGAAIRHPAHMSQAMSEVFHEAAEHAWESAPYVALSIRYNDTGAMQFSEALRIEQHDSAYQSMFGAGSVKDNSIRSFLLNFLPSGPPSSRMRDFDPGQYLHLQAIASAPQTLFETALQSGESTTWEIRRFDYPVPLAHALTVIGHTTITIGAVGSVAETLEDILPHLTPAIPGSMSFSNFERALAESHEKWQRDARQHAEEWRQRRESSDS